MSTAFAQLRAAKVPIAVARVLAGRSRAAHYRRVGPLGAATLGPVYGHDGRGGCRPRRFPHGLTTRQLEILELVRDGFTGPQIAARLNISPKDRRPPFTASLAKLDVRSRVEAGRGHLQLEQ